MRALRGALLLTGALLLGYLVYRVGAGPIVETIARLTWWQFGLVCLPYALITAIDTLGWRFAFARDRAPFWRLMGARLAGEALNVVTALGSVGGEAVKVWLVRRDVAYAESVASVIVAKTTITIAQALFLALGSVLAWFVLPPGSPLLRTMGWLLVVEALAVGGFLGAQLGGLPGWASRLLSRFGAVGESTAEEFAATLQRFYRSEWPRFALSIGFHLVGWLLGALEVLVILAVLHLPVTLTVATVIEALGSAVRFASFLVPANLGALEGANAGAFEALGLGAASGLAFSFVRRARQAVWIALGIVILVLMRWRDTRAPAPDTGLGRRRVA